MEEKVESKRGSIDIEDARDIIEDDKNSLDLQTKDLADLLGYMDETTDSSMERAISKMLDIVLSSHSEKFKLMLIALGRRKIKNIFKMDAMVDSLLEKVDVESREFKKLPLEKRVKTLRTLKEIMNKDMDFISKIADRKLALDETYLEALQSRQILSGPLVQEVKDEATEAKQEVLDKIKGMSLDKRKKLQRMINDFTNTIKGVRDEPTEDTGSKDSDNGTSISDGPPRVPDSRPPRPLLPDNREETPGGVEGPLRDDGPGEDKPVIILPEKGDSET